MKPNIRGFFALKLICLWALVGAASPVQAVERPASPKLEMQKKFHLSGSLNSKRPIKKKPLGLDGGGGAGNPGADYQACVDKWKAIWSSGDAEDALFVAMVNAPFFDGVLAKMDSGCMGYSAYIAKITAAVSAYSPEQFQNELAICLTPPNYNSPAELIADGNAHFDSVNSWCKVAKPCLEAGTTVQKADCPKVAAAMALYKQNNCALILGPKAPALKTPTACAGNSGSSDTSVGGVGGYSQTNADKNKQKVKDKKMNNNSGAGPGAGD